MGQTREREGVGSWAALGRPRKRERTGPVQRGPEHGKGNEGRVGLQQVWAGFELLVFLSSFLFQTSLKLI